jgi:hypothetical protein
MHQDENGKIHYSDGSGALKSVCPITFTAQRGPFECCEEQCAWWVTHYKGKDYEYSECCIRSIICLEDMQPGG